MKAKNLCGICCVLILSFIISGCGISVTVSDNADSFVIVTENGVCTGQGSDYTITAAGSYTLSGTLHDGRIIIDAGEDAKIELILSGCSISCKSDSPIRVLSAKELKIKAQNGSESEINDLRNPGVEYDGDEKYAAVFASCDIELCGKGSLCVNAFCGDGIHSREKLNIKNINLTINANGSCLKGKEGITLESGSLTLVSSGGSGMRTSDSSVSSKGSIHGNIEIKGGSVSVSAYNDGIHAENRLIISGGDVSVIHAREGFEANVIEISGGNVSVFGSDDGMNACKGNSEPLISISGGFVEIETPSGDTDGIDSNGSYVQSGGIVIVKGGSDMGGVAGSVDVEGSITVNGGSIVALGGICELPENDVNVYANSEFRLNEGSYTLNIGGSDILSFDISSGHSGIWICSDAITLGKSCELKTASGAVLAWIQEEEAVIIGSGGFVGGGRPDGDFGGGRPDGGFGGNPPDGGFGGNPPDGGFGGNPPDGGFGGGAPVGEIPSPPDGERPFAPDGGFDGK